jgi:hypothetical protein
LVERRRGWPVVRCGGSGRKRRCRAVWLNSWVQFAGGREAGRAGGRVIVAPRSEQPRGQSNVSIAAQQRLSAQQRERGACGREAAARMPMQGSSMQT